jgi:hypothetical protein
MRKAHWIAVACLFSVGGFADMLHLVVAGGKYPLSDAAELYGCIAYQGCDLTAYSLADNIRVHIYTEKNLDEVRQALGNCDLSGVSLPTISYYDDGNHTHPLLLPRTTSPKLDLAPAVLGNTRLSRLDSILKKIERIAPKNVVSAVDSILASLGIQAYGYHTTYDPKIIATVGGLTLYETKTVSFPRYRRLDGEFLENAVHEYTHVQQWHILDTCTDETATFASHDRRERAAYLQGMRFDRYLHSPSNGVNYRIQNILNYKN